MAKPIEEAEPDSNPVIRMLTYNVWGLRYISRHRRPRLRAIADRLATDDEQYDIVALQEVWCEEDWRYIDEVCRRNYPHRRFFRSGMVTGPGLAILSRIPIDETFLYRFPINGRASAFFRGDWFVGKSIAVTLLKPHSKTGAPIAVLNSHMHAPYGASGDKNYLTHRACQAWDMTKIIRILKRAGYAVIQVGDLNSKPNSLPYKLFTVEAGLQDSWEVYHGTEDQHDIPNMTPEDQITFAGVTCNSRLNSWRYERPISDAVRLDYALIDPSLIKPIEVLVKFTELVPQLNCSYSDHFAYNCNFQVVNNSENLPQYSPTDKINVYQELISVIQTYRTNTIPWQAGWRKYHLITSVIAVTFIHGLLGLFWFAPPVVVALTFCSTIIGITGIVNGLIWYLGVRSELRALQEVQMEVEDLFASVKNE